LMRIAILTLMKVKYRIPARPLQGRLGRSVESNALGPRMGLLQASVGC
jgi:hypothetical protein